MGGKGARGRLKFKLNSGGGGMGFRTSKIH